MDSKLQKALQKEKEELTQIVEMIMKSRKIFPVTKKYLVECIKLEIVE